MEQIFYKLRGSWVPGGVPFDKLPNRRGSDRRKEDRRKIERRARTEGKGQGAI